MPPSRSFPFSQALRVFARMYLGDKHGKKDGTMSIASQHNQMLVNLALANLTGAPELALVVQVLVWTKRDQHLLVIIQP